VPAKIGALRKLIEDRCETNPSFCSFSRVYEISVNCCRIKINGETTRSAVQLDDFVDWAAKD